MQHVKISFATPPEMDTDILMAMLMGAGYDGFEETGDELFAYIDDFSFDEVHLNSIADELGRSYTKEIIPLQNWNALWESNFQPVIIDNFCTIRAHFHEMTETTPYDIIITPKMSFGTGHHATTQLMITMMKDLSLTGKSVLDFGTGTGVLAIMAEMLGAANILAIDNDQWCVDNSMEIIERNHCKNITVHIGSLEDIAIDKADVILANINRHILLNYMPALYKILNKGGSLLMSGLLVEDKEIILEEANDKGFHFTRMCEQNGWIALLFEKELTV